MGRKKIQLAPKSKLGYNDKLKICYNCCFYQVSNNGWCPWEDTNKNYNDYSRKNSTFNSNMNETLNKMRKNF